MRSGFIVLVLVSVLLNFCAPPQSSSPDSSEVLIQKDTILGTLVVEEKEVVFETKEIIEEEEIVEELPKGYPAPKFTLRSTEHESVALADLKGNLVLLEFWFPGCRGCLASIPMLNALQAKYKEQGLKVYGIEHRDVSTEEVDDYMKKHQMNFPSLYYGKTISKAYGVWLAPAFYLINKEGNIVFENNYSDDNQKMLEEFIEKYI